MNAQAQVAPSSLYDADLPTANDVMASLCCVSTQYARQPSLALALLAESLAQTLNAPEYAENQLITAVAQRLLTQWQAVVTEQRQLEVQVMPAQYRLQ